MRLIDADKTIGLLKTRLYETALNNATVNCDASQLYTECADNRIEVWMDEMPTVDAVDRKLFNKVCEQFALDDPQWICDEMSDHDDEWEICEKNCEYSMCQPQCIERYARLLLKTDEVEE